MVNTPVHRVADGQTHKVIRLVATSPHSWEEAAQVGVEEAAKTIVDLESAEATEMDIVLEGGSVRLYRVKLEMVFQLDRSRRSASDEIVQVKRHLIVANQTLVSQALHELVDERVAAGPAEFHLVAPRAQRSAVAQILDRVPPIQARLQHSDDTEQEEAEERVRLFSHAFSRLGDALTSEVGDPDPVLAVQRVLERGSFDEIVLSMLPPSASRLRRRDLVADLERAVAVPVTALIHDEGDDITSCPIG